MLTLEECNERCRGTLVELLGIELVEIKRGIVSARVAVRKELLAPNGYLHAAAVIGLADTACGFGALASLPPGATSFTTIELKTNFAGTAREGAIVCEAKLVHGGRTTQVWDAEVTSESNSEDGGRVVALFRCTQLLLYPGKQA